MIIHKQYCVLPNYKLKYKFVHLLIKFLLNESTVDNEYII